MQLKDAEMDVDLRTILSMDETLDLLMATGFRRAVSQLTLADRDYVVSALLDYHLMGKVKAEMDQFIDGLSTLGLLDVIRANPEKFEPFFLHSNVKLTSGIIILVGV